MSDEKKSNGSINRALAVVRCCACHPDGVTFSLLQKECGGLPSMTLSRLLKPLADEGVVVKGPGDGLYRFGSDFLAIARAALGNQTKEDIIQPVLDELSRETEESSAYFDWDGDWVQLLAKTEVPNSFHYAPLRSRSNHRTWNMFFKAVLAFLSEETMNGVYKRDGYSVPEIPHDDLASIRNGGVFVDFERIRGTVLRIVAPVFRGEDREVAGAIGITTMILDPVPEELERLKGAVKSAAAKATQGLNSSAFGS